MKFTRKGYIEVLRDDVFISRHTAAEEAYESAAAHAEAHGGGVYVIRYPNRELDLSTIQKTVDTDTVAPTETTISVTAVTVDSVSLSCTISVDAIGVAGYTIERSADGTNPQAPTNTAGWSVLQDTTTRTHTDSSLSAGTDYFYRASARDASGNRSAWTTVTGTTALLDTTAPTMPVLSVSDFTSSSITVVCTQSTDAVGVAGYTFEYTQSALVYATYLQVAPQQNGWLPAQTPSTSRTCQVTGLSADTTYYFRVSSYDAAGNRSAWSPANATTAATGSPTYFTADTTTIFANPERGFLLGLGSNGLLDATTRFQNDINAIKAGYVSGHGLYLGRCDTTIGSSLLTSTQLQQIQSNFDKARNSGIKLVPFFRYGTTMPTIEPVLSRVLEHIDQLGTVFEANKDVIHCLFAGMIGAWGEWHSSATVAQGGLNDPPLSTYGPKLTIRDRILAQWPDEIPVLFRHPYMQQEVWFPGVELDEGTAFSGSTQARCGTHNDCFLVGNGDAYTYPPATYIGEFDITLTQSELSHRQYAARMTEYVPFGGETCSNAGGRTACSGVNDTAGLPGGILLEGPRYHLNFLNGGYYQAFYNCADETGSWVTNGCISTVKRLMGYRLQLDSISHSSSVNSGGQLNLTVAMRNYGWSRIFSARKLRATFVHTDGTTYTADSTTELRRLPSQATSSTNVEIAWTAPAKTGTYTVYLSCPDIWPNTSTKREYAIRFANSDAAGQVWDNTLGRISTGTTVSVT